MSSPPAPHASAGGWWALGRGGEEEDGQPEGKAAAAPGCLSPQGKAMLSLALRRGRDARTPP